MFVVLLNGNQLIHREKRDLNLMPKMRMMYSYTAREDHKINCISPSCTEERSMESISILKIDYNWLKKKVISPVVFLLTMPV